MRRLGENDYEQSKRRNKNSKNIVYEFADEMTIEVTLEEYLKSNPGKTEVDYLELKKWSDEDYVGQNSGESKHSRVGKRLLQIMKDKQSEWKNEDHSEEEYIFKKKQELIKDAEYILSKLSDKQRRRYLMHHVDGLTTGKIAKLEGRSQQAIHQSLKSANKKIEDIYAEMVRNQKLNEEKQKREELLSSYLDKLTAIQQRRYLMHYSEGLSMREIAKREGCSQPMIYKSIKEARKKLKMSSSEADI
ncbi:MAG: hypothetical protein FWC91_07145 [Defluviitaleaceae bacterium]|nr:hypothetical protein [Defluviitaleaceae bacterium]